MWPSHIRECDRLASVKFLDCFNGFCNTTANHRTCTVLLRDRLDPESIEYSRLVRHHSADLVKLDRHVRSCSDQWRYSGQPAAPCAADRAISLPACSLIFIIIIQLLWSTMGHHALTCWSCSCDISFMVNSLTLLTHNGRVSREVLT
jgi:hypothetical protein